MGYVICNHKLASAAIHLAIFLCVLSAPPAYAIDTLQVTPTDPILEPWRWTTFDRTSAVIGDVKDVLEDRDGNIWLATDRGVQRYDGLGWTTYTAHDGLADNDVRAICQTRDGALWFGTWGAGISRFDGQTWTTYTTADGLASNFMYWPTFLEAQDGTLWAGFLAWGDRTGTNAGISQFDGKTWTTVDVPVGNPRPGIADIAEAADGTLWFTIYYGGGALRFDGQTWTQQFPGRDLNQNMVWNILSAQDGTIFFTCFREGISRFDPVTSQWQVYTPRDGLPEGTVLQNLWQTADGRIWFGGQLGRFGYFDGERWHTYPADVTPWLTETVWGYPISDGTIWFIGRGFEEVHRFDPTSERWSNPFDFQSGFRDNDRPAEYVFPADDEVWFNGQDGALRFDGENWIRYTTKDGLLDGWVYAVLKDNSGNIWVSGQHRGKSGVARYDGKSWRVFSEADGLVGSNIFTSFVANNGDLWFGTRGTGSSAGLMRFDGHKWHVYTTQDGLTHDRIYSFAQTSDGDIWVGTYRGLSRFDGEQWIQYTTLGDNGLHNLKIWALCGDQSGDLWIGHGEQGGGVTQFDPETNAWKRYTTEDGLCNNSVRDIRQAQDGSLWFGTDAGFSRFDGTHWSSYLSEEIPANLGRIRTIAEMPDGSFWIGGQESSIRFVPDRNLPETILEPTVDRVSPSGHILLRWSGHDFWNDTPTQNLRYTWRMDEGEWSKISNRTDFTFTSLASDKHVFEVRAIDRDGNEDLTPAVHAFVVEPVWWQNPWIVVPFFLLLGLAGIQTGRTIQKGHLLAQANTTLETTVSSLKTEMEERERTEAERVALDTQLTELRYLYRLRSALGEARTLNDIAQQSGDTLMEALSVSASTGIKIVLGDRTWTFGIVDKTAQTRQSRALSWGGRARGKLQLYCTFELNEAQERTLLYETAEQIVHALETRELESELLRSARLVSMGEMAASVAHELHQPLGAISATAEDVYMRLIENIDLSPEDLKEMMQDMLGFVERMAGTVDHLRVFSRDTSKEPGVQFSINDVIRSSLKLIETQLQNHGITLILELSEELPQIDGHPYQIEQVFLNLLSNARDALDEREGVEKRIVVRSLEGDGGVNVEVEDNGAGISEAHLDRLFDPFFTTKEAGQGTGLGLAISYAIVKNHGGEMKCESLQDHGALFWVALPEVR